MNAGIFGGGIATQEFAIGLSQLGTDGSNPSPSSGESVADRDRGDRRKQRWHRCPQTIQPLPPCSGPPLASLTPGPPQRASIPVLVLEAQPPTGLPSRPTCRGAGPLQVLKTQDSRATPGRPARFGQSTMPTSQ